MTVTLTTVAGWNLYLVVLSPGEANVWNGSAFVTYSAAAANAGGDATPGTESPSGTYTFTFPAGITTNGVYPIVVYRRLGASANVATDTRITPTADENTVTVSGSTGPALDGLHSPAEVIRQAMVDGAIGTAAGTWPVWSTNEHDTPDDALTVYDTVGTEDGRVMWDGSVQSHFGVMVRVRGQTHAAGFVKADEVRRFLSETVRNTTVTIATSGSRTGATYLVHAVTKIGQPMYLGSDVPNSRRKLFTINATVALRRVT